MVKLMAPVLSFTAEEIWKDFSGRKGEESIHTLLFPEVNEEWLDQDLFERWEKIVLVRREVAKVLESARRDKVIGHSLDASVRLFCPTEFGLPLAEYDKDLSDIFITSSVYLSDEKGPPEGSIQSEEIPGLWVQVKQNPGTKCERCWKYSDTVGTTPEHSSICTRCVANL